MADFIEKKPETNISSEQEVWMISNRFKINIHIEKDEDIYFIRDLNKNDESQGIKQFDSLEDIPRVIKLLDLDSDYQVKIWPSIDTCGLLVNKKYSKEVFNILEKYLTEKYVD